MKKHDTDIVIDPSDEEHPVWFTSSDLVDCAESACKVKIDIFAPEGTEITYQSDSGSENIVVIGSEGFEILDLSLSLIVTTKLTIYAGTFEETYYLRATDLNPKMSLKNPVVCPESAEYCNRYDLMDDPETDAIELAEVGYGYDDDLVPDDGILNVKDESAIIFYVYDSATGGVVEIENPPEGLNFTTANLVRGEQENLYIADFSSLEIADTAADGQTDYELVFVLKTDSGIVQKYLVYVHLDLKIPDAVQLSAVSADKLLAELSLSWDPLSVKPYAYELRYQSYTGSCSISDNFDSAEKPSTDYAGDIPKPQDSLMTYKFFVNKVSNSDGTLSADVHKNGNSYCAGVRAVSGVFGNKNQLFAKNYGKIGADSVHDFGALQLNWQSVYEASSGYHSFYLVTIGDVNGDSFEDYVIADKFKSDSGVDSERNGFVDVYSGKDSALLKSFRGGTGNNERVGSGVSSKADFNGDGFYDFAYTNYEGKVDIYYGSETGINFNAVQLNSLFYICERHINRCINIRNQVFRVISHYFKIVQLDSAVKCFLYFNTSIESAFCCDSDAAEHF